MQVEVVTIPVYELYTTIVDAVAKGIQNAKQQEVIQDTYITVSEVRKLIDVKINQTVIKMCEDGILEHTCKVGVEREDGKSAKKTRLISKNSIIKFLKNKR